MAIGEPQLVTFGGNQPCFQCGISFGQGEKPFYWVGFTGAIFLHVDCLIVWWMGGLRLDVERARAEWAAEID